MIQTERKWRFALGGIFSQNMKELSRIAGDLVHLEKAKKHIALASNANGRSDGAMKKEHIQKAKKYAEDWLKHNLPESERRSHFLFSVTQIADDADDVQIRNLLSSLDTDINARTGRRIVIRAEQQINIRRQAESVSRLPKNDPRWSRLSKAK